MIKYLVVCIIIHIFAKPYAISIDKGRENCQQINTTMKIAEIRKQLVGKHIVYYNGYNGWLDYFTIGYACRKGESIMVSPSVGRDTGIYIPEKHLEELMSKGYFSRTEMIEGCMCREEWQLKN